MIIRCPQCEHSRSINESKIPPTAELATCPKCKHRFRFRTLRHAREPEPEASEQARPEQTRPQQAHKERPVAGHPAPEVIRPQGAFRETAGQNDIWDAVDALHQRWHAQLDQHVTEVDSFRPPPATSSPPDPDRDAPQTTAPPLVTAEQGGSAPEPFFPQQEEKKGTEPLPHETIQAPLPETPPKGSPTDETAWREQEAAPAGSPDFAAPPAPAHPAALPYSENGARPEDRVEHDLQMLHAASDARHLRDLGRLGEDQDAGGESDAPSGTVAGEESAAWGVPWENPARHGWAKGFVSTVKDVMFRGPAFFSGMTPEGSLAPGYLFFLLLGYLTILSSLAWEQAAAVLLPGILPLSVNRFVLPVLLLLAPIALGLMLLFVTGFIRIIVSLLGPENADFALVYKVVSYSVAPFVLSVVPFVGPPIGALWFLGSLILGCRYALRLSWPLASFAPLLPAALLLGGLIWYFL